MNWAMSDDYAALITTVILAVLLIGTVQAYTLFKAWGDGVVETIEWMRPSIDNIIQAGRTGAEPPAEDLAKIDRARESNQAVRQKAAALVAFIVWLAICAVLVSVQIAVMEWSATHSPEEKAPGLARFAFVACSASIVILVMEGVVRVVVRTAIGLKKQNAELNRYTAEDKHRYLEALRSYREAQQVPPPDPAD
jgi:hypothetical protein